MSIVSFKPSKTKTKKQKKFHTWLRERISSFDFGIKYLDRTGKWQVVHANTNDVVLSARNQTIWSWLQRLTNKKMDEHFSGSKTFYFTGNESSKHPETLVMIDIDCHKSGSLAGAINFAEHLEQVIFQNMYFETSTNGNGVHGYVVLRKEDLGAETINGLLKRLDRHLKQVLSEGDFDVETVEVKGTLPEFTWINRRCTSMKAGQLAKLPRELSRASEIMATTVLMPNDLMRLPIYSETKPTIKTPTIKRAVSGSITGKVISEKEIGRIKTDYLRTARMLLASDKFKIAGRKSVTENDLAIFLCLGRYFTENMNADGSLPYERYRQLWNCLFECGDIDRAFDSQRFAAMRNLISTLNLVSWNRAGYEVGYFVDDRYVKGQAARWQFSEMLMGMMEEKADENWNTEREELESILCTNTKIFFDQNPLSTTKRPTRIWTTVRVWCNHDPCDLVEPFSLAA